MLTSGLFKGVVIHRRYEPKQHHFSYSVAMWGIALSELEPVHSCSTWLSTKNFAPLWFKRKDYLPGSEGSLEEAVLFKCSELANHSIKGEVYFLGGLRTWGVFFSPINCYFIREPNRESFTYMLAEVSNTPWHERHYYLLDLTKPLAHDKAFHVSPFNPMDMQYQWRIKSPSQSAIGNCLIHLDAIKGTKHFSATLKLTKGALNSNSILRVLIRYPWNSLTTLVAIYWQALKLWVKRTPLYSHPRTK